MDEDTSKLVLELCTHAGMMMEDASLLALTLRGTKPNARGEIIQQLRVTAEKIGYLLAGAAALQV